MLLARPIWSEPPSELTATTSVSILLDKDFSLNTPSISVTYTIELL